MIYTPCISNKPSQFDIQGVYIITTPDDKEIVWVGETTTPKVIERIKYHCTLKQSSDLNVVLKKHPDYPQDYNLYLVRCFGETDVRRRGQLEHFLIGVLQPVFNNNKSLRHYLAGTIKGRTHNYTLPLMNITHQ